jgi:hypothetical protein
MMTAPDFQAVANAVLRRAQQQGYVVAKEIRAELKAAALPEDRWKEVVELLRQSLHYRQGRYYFINVASSGRQRLRDQQLTVRTVIQEMLDTQGSKTTSDDRRREDRVDYVRTVQVRTEDGQELTVVSRDLSPGGIRLVAGRSLLGLKLHVLLPREGMDPLTLVARILWTTAVGDGLFESGGTFLEVLGS